MSAEHALWSALPLVLHTLAVEDPDAVLDCAQAVATTNPALIERAISVCARLDLIDRLREERTLSGQDIYAERRWRDIDQLTAYLAATGFAIAEGGGPESAAGFDAFLERLPPWLQEWLGAAYAVLPADADPEASLRRWRARSSAARRTLVAAHLATLVATYPSTVDYTPWDEHDRLHAREAIRRARYEFLWLHETGDRRLPLPATVGVKAGLPESDVLRFLLVVGLRGGLGLQDGPGLIDAYWARRQVRVWGLRALKELEDNLNHLHAWSAESLHERSARADYLPLAGLPTTAALMLWAEREALARATDVPVDSVEAYLEGVQRINSQVAALNQRTAAPDFGLEGKAAEEAAVLRSILSDADTRALVSRIKALHQQLARAVASL